jgi:hypothetical protein
MAQESVFSGVLDVWGGGQLLAFSGLDGPTDYAHALVARTAFDGVGIDVKLPGRCALRFGEGEAGDLLLAGDLFQLTTPAGAVRGAFLDAHHLLIEGPCRVDAKGPEIAVAREGARTLVAAAAKLDASALGRDLDAAMEDRSRWLASRRLPGDLPPLRRKTLYKALSIMKTQVCTPEGHVRHRWTTPDRWPHRGLWLWDSAFHAIGWRHVDVGLAREMLQAVLDGQREDGQVPIRTVPNRRHEFTQPPVLALAAMRIEQTEPDRDWLAEVYPALCAQVEWDLSHRDSDGAGLVEWAVEENVHCRSGESGMDNSPRFDSARPLDATDFNAYLALECEILARFAESLGRGDDAGRWTQRRRALCEGINRRLWNEDRGLYVDCDAETGRQTGVLAGAGFFPLICGAASDAQADRLAGHLRNAETFATPLPVPTIAACDTEHYAKDMWRGCVWVNVNWLIAWGLDRYGYADLAGDIRRRTVEEIEYWYGRYGSIFEFYDDRRELPPPQLLRKGKCAPRESPFHQVFFDYGWSATLYVDMVGRLAVGRA